MKKFLILIILFFGITTGSYAQCAFDNVFYINLTPAAAGTTATDACVWGGDLVTVNVVAGESYTISLCANNVFGFDDSQITLYDAAGITLLGYNDDFCGLYSQITYVATYTGVLNVVIDEYFCTSNTSCMQLDITWNGTPPPPVTNITCSQMAPICTSTGLSFTASNTGTTAEPGNNYDCLLTFPDPTWYYLEISQSGAINMNLFANQDIDYIIWGPFPNLAAATASCGNLGQVPTATNGSVIDCSYSGTNNEFPTIPSAIVGEVYVMLITNYAGVVQNLSLTQTGGTGATNCAIVTCAADAGTITTTFNSTTSGNLLVMCKGDCITIETDSNYVLPPPLAGEEAELMYALYDGPPNPSIQDPSLDPNYTGLLWTGGDFSDCNNPASIILGAGLSSHVWLVPITMDDGDNNGNPNGAINWDNDGDGCWALGTPIEIVYLDSIMANFNDNCGTVTVMLSGGYPGFNTLASYVVINNGVGTMVQSGANGEILTFTNYTPGQALSITVTNDGNGCARTFNYTTRVPGTVTLDNIVNTNCGAATGEVNISFPGSCTYTLNMFDSYGDGWNGASLAITANGVPVPGSPFSVSLAQGSSATASFTVPAGQTVVLTYTAGSWEGEVTYNLVLNGATIYSAGPNPPTGIVFTTSCTPPTTYQWSNGAITQDITGLGSGAYTVTVTDQFGCTTTGGPYTVNTNGGVTATLGSTMDATCNGAATGSVNITVNGGTLPHSFLWSNGATTQNLSNVSANTYIVTVTDAGGCTTTVSGTVNEPTALTASAVAADAACNGAATGSVTLTPGGGTPIYTYNWSNGAITQNLSNVVAGVYTATVTDNNGCTTTASATVGEPTALTASAVAADAACNGAATGSVTLTPSGGTPIYTYNWSNGAITQNLSNVVAGLYTATVTDNNGCTTTASATVGEPTALTASAVATDAACNGAATGSVTLTPGGGTPIYTYNWSNGAITQNLSNVVAGLYTATVTDNNGCTTTASATVSEPTALTASAVATDAACNGAATGSVTLTPGGGTPIYTYNWSNGAITQNLSNVVAGLYTATVTDNNGCTTTASATVGQPTVLTTSTTVTDAACGGATDGSVALSVGGGSPTYTFLWSNGAITQNLSNVGAGSYVVTVTDNNGCTTTASANVNTPSGMTLTIASEDVACNGGTTGALDLTVSGGTPSYTFMWSNGATTEDLTGLAAGTYTVTVMDGNSCSSILTDSVTQSAALNVALTPTDITCNGANDGCITAVVTGGTGNYSYTWSNAATATTICGLAAGGYSITVVDTVSSGNLTIDTLYAEGFQGVHNWTLNIATGANGADNNFWVVNDNEGGVLPPGCGVGGNGDRTLHITSVFNPSGGAAYDAGGLCGFLFCPLTNRRAESPIFSTVGRTNITLEFDFISQGDALLDNASVWYNDGTGWAQAVASIKSGCCGGACTGFNQGQWQHFTVVLPASCNNNPTVQVAFNWTNNDDGAGTDPSVAINNVLVTGESGGGSLLVCTEIASTTISEPSALTTSTASIIDATCSTAGSVDINVGGGTAGYTFLWSNGETTEDITGLTAGAYTVTIEDANGCTITNGPNNVASIGAHSVTLNSTTNVTCNGAANGEINIDISGGTTPYSFLWSNSATTEDLTGLTPGIYDVTVTDDIGCVVPFGSVTITEPSALSITDVNNDVSCNGALDGNITLTVSGGTSGYTFLWDNGAVTQDLTGISGGTYAVTVTDANSCTMSYGAVTISEPSALATSTVSVIDATCSTLGAVDIDISGGTAGYTFLWSNGETTEDITGLIAGAYTVTIEDANGCTITNGPNNVADIGTPTVSLIDSIHVSCNGAADGEINIDISGGTAPYSFLWSNGATTEDISGLVGGVYDVTVTDDIGCVVPFGSVTITEPSALSITDVSNDVSCNNAADGNITLTISGGTSGYTFLWDNGAVTQVLTNISGGTYNVTVTDANGCTDSHGPVIINEQTAITASNIVPTAANCGLANGAIDLDVTGGTGGYIYDWSNGATTEDITGLVAGDYVVIVTDAAGCDFTTTITVASSSNINLGLVSSVDESCNLDNSGAITISISGGDAPYTFEWSNGATTQDLTGISGGTYAVTVTDATGCIVTNNFAISNPLIPTINPFVEPTNSIDTTIIWNTDTDLNGGNDQSTSGVAYVWTSVGPSNANFTAANSHNTTINPDNDGDYTFILTATSADGCIAIDSIHITVEAANNPEIPTAFTPNNDDNNDVFQVVRLDKSLLREFKVFNRWGQVVYDNATEGAWNGKMKGTGTDQPEEVYIYIISWQLPSETELTVVRGQVTLIR